MGEGWFYGGCRKGDKGVSSSRGNTIERGVARRLPGSGIGGGGLVVSVQQETAKCEPEPILQPPLRRMEGECRQVFESRVAVAELDEIESFEEIMEKASKPVPSSSTRNDWLVRENMRKKRFPLKLEDYVGENLDDEEGYARAITPLGPPTRGSGSPPAVSAFD